MEPGAEGATLAVCSLVVGVGRLLVRRARRDGNGNGRSNGMAHGVIASALRRCFTGFSVSVLVEGKNLQEFCISLGWLAGWWGGMLVIEADGRGWMT